MPPKTKTSFIAETKYQGGKELKYREAGVGFFFKLAVFLLVLSLLGSLGALFYKKTLTQKIDDLSVSLERAIASFDLAFISELDGLSKKIPVVKELLGKHRYPTKIFELLEESTLAKVKFSRFNYTIKEANSETRFVGSQNPLSTAGEDGVVVSLTLSGEAESYTVLAQQAEVFSLNDRIDSFSFSDFALTPEGNVSFNLDIVFNQNIFEF